MYSFFADKSHLITLWNQINSNFECQRAGFVMTTMQRFSRINVSHLFSLQTADIAAASLTVTAERAKAIDLSHPFMESGLSIVLKRPNTRGWHALKGFVTFLEPFAPGVWITLLVACLIVPVLYGVVIQ